MIVLGSSSEVAQAFVEKVLSEGEKFECIYLFTSNPETTEKFAKHIDVKFFQASKIIELNIIKELNFNDLNSVNSSLLFCAVGHLGQGTEEGFEDHQNTEKIIALNYAKLIPLLNFFSQKFAHKRKGNIIALSSVAGDRGRQSNFIYGSAKAGLTAYLSGLRNYLYDKRVHVLTVKPGFMATKMTEGLALNPMLTASPKQAANHIYRAYKNQRNVVYVLPIWWLIMLVIKNIPEFIFKKMKM